MKTNHKHSYLYGIALALAVIPIMVLSACSSGTVAAPTTQPANTSIQAPANTQGQGQTTPSSMPSQNQPNSGRGGSASGTITAMNGNTMTVKTDQGQVTVNIASNTSVQKNTAVTLSDLQTGDFLTVMGTADSQGNIAASSIMVRQQQQSPRQTPTGVPSGNFTMGSNGPSGTPPASQVPSNSSGTPPTSQGQNNGASGTLATISGTTLTISTTQGKQVTVTTDSNTKIQKTVSGTISDLQVGATVSVFGQSSSDGSINAFSITIN